MSRIDLQPAAAELSRLVEGTRDDQLGAPTPLDDTSVAALLAHISRLSQAFSAAARKTTYGDGGPPPPPSDEQLPADWRTATPPQLAELAVAWSDPAAWEGTTGAGGVEASAAEIGVVALDELVIHGWDLARATGQSFSCDAVSMKAVLAFTGANATPRGGQQAGLFGPAVEVPADAPDLDRALGFAGRRPDWAPDPSRAEPR
jgi:uncharacterized protein (TIGR03086 family)